MTILDDSLGPCERESCPHLLHEPSEFLVSNKPEQILASLQCLVSSLNRFRCVLCLARMGMGGERSLAGLTLSMA